MVGNDGAEDVYVVFRCGVYNGQCDVAIMMVGENVGWR